MSYLALFYPALVIFFATHIYGLKENGFGHIKHLFGPIIKWYALPLMILMFAIEVSRTADYPQESGEPVDVRDFISGEQRQNMTSAFQAALVGQHHAAVTLMLPTRQATSAAGRPDS